MRILDNIDKNKWEQFVLSFEKSNIFSSFDLVETFQKSEDFEIFPKFVIDDDNNIVAAAFPVLVKIQNFFFPKYTNRLILFSTPLFFNNDKGIEGIKLILCVLKEIARKKSLFLEIRNSEKFPYENFSNILENFEYIPYQNYIIDLTLGKEKLWENLNTFTRNHIRKSEKKGVVISEIDENDLEECVDLIITLYKKKKIPVLNRSIFFNAYKLLKEKKYIRVISAKYQGNVVGVRISLNYNKTVYDWYAASKSEFNNFYINETLAWNSIRWAADNNYKIFDFGGGAIKGQFYGPANFKEKFKGELVEYGRYRYYPNSWLYKIATKFYELRTGNKIR